MLEVKLNGNDRIAKMDNVVKNAVLLPGECIDHGVHYLIVDHLRRGPPMVLAREICLYIHELGLENRSKLIASAFRILPATQSVLSTGSIRRSANDANAGIALCNDIDNNLKKEELNKKRKQQKRKAARALEPAKEKKPVFKGEGHKLNEETTTATSEEVNESIDSDNTTTINSKELEGYMDSLNEAQHAMIQIAKKMGRNYLGGSKESTLLDEAFFDNNNSQLSRATTEDMKFHLKHLKELEFVDMAMACVNDGLYEMKRLTMGECRREHGQCLKDMREEGDESDEVEVKFKPCRNSGLLKGGVERFGRMTMDELVKAAKDILSCTEEGNDPKILFEYQNLGLYCREIFWNVIYNVQPVVPETGRLHYGEMIKSLLPDHDWDFLMPKVVTRASTSASSL